MELFPDRQHVRLRNLELDTCYLHAADDGEGVCISKRRFSVRAAWKVHIYHDNEGAHLLLHSAAYGRYLAATNTRARIGHIGFRAEQRDYDQPVVLEAMWLPVRAGSAGGVLLRDRAGRYLRANGKYLRWMVEPIGLRDGPPRIPPTIWARLPEGWHAFHFRGRSLNHLRNDLAGHVGQQPNGIVLCVRAGRYGRLTPLVVDQPRCGYGEILQIIIITTGTPGYNALRYQYVDQQPRGITTETPASTPIGNPGSDQRRDPDENINSKAEVLKQNTEQNINYRPEVALCQQSGQRELFPSG